MDKDSREHPYNHPQVQRLVDTVAKAYLRLLEKEGVIKTDKTSCAVTKIENGNRND